MPGEEHSGRRGLQGFVIGELLVALLLLAVAVSSLAALMYSVSRRPEADSREPVACVAKNGKMPGNCASHSTSGGASKLLRSGCAAKIGTTARGCDSVPGFDSLEETIVRSRTDSASLALLAKKQEQAAARAAPRRPDRGFIR